MNFSGNAPARAAALYTSALVAVAAWQSDMLVCRGPTFAILEQEAASDNRDLIFEDKAGGIIVFAAKGDENGRNPYFQFVFRDAKDRPSASYVSSSVRMIDETDVTDEAHETLVSIQTKLPDAGRAVPCP